MLYDLLCNGGAIGIVLIFIALAIGWKLMRDWARYRKSEN